MEAYVSEILRPKPDMPEPNKKLVTKARKNENTKKSKDKFRAHAAQAPALRVPDFVFS